MNALGLLTRNVYILCLGAVAALIVLGPLLDLAWLLDFMEHLALKMI